MELGFHTVCCPLCILLPSGPPLSGSVGVSQHGASKCLWIHFMLAPTEVRPQKYTLLRFTVDALIHIHTLLRSLESFRKLTQIQLKFDLKQYQIDVISVSQGSTTVCY